MPQVTHGVLKNGLHYYVMPNGHPAGRVMLRLIVRVRLRSTLAFLPRLPCWANGFVCAACSHSRASSPCRTHHSMHREASVSPLHVAVSALVTGRTGRLGARDRKRARLRAPAGAHGLPLDGPLPQHGRDPENHGLRRCALGSLCFPLLSLLLLVLRCSIALLPLCVCPSCFADVRVSACANARPACVLVAWHLASVLLVSGPVSECRSGSLALRMRRCGVRSRSQRRHKL